LINKIKLQLKLLIKQLKLVLI